MPGSLSLLRKIEADESLPIPATSSVPALTNTRPLSAALSAVKLSVPGPFLASAPPPETVPGNVTSSERLNASVPAVSTTSPVSDPAVPPSPIWSVPAVIVVPVTVATLVSVRVLPPCFSIEPVPEISPAKVRSVPLLNRSVPSLLISPTTDPLIDNVPSSIVVPPV